MMLMLASRKLSTKMGESPGLAADLAAPSVATGGTHACALAMRVAALSPMASTGLRHPAPAQTHQAPRSTALGRSTCDRVDLEGPPQLKSPDPDVSDVSVTSSVPPSISADMPSTLYLGDFNLTRQFHRRARGPASGSCAMSNRIACWSSVR